MQIERRQRIAGALDLADQSIDLLASEQQFARARRIGAHMRGRRGERAHMRTNQDDLAVLDDDVRLFQIGAARPDRLHFPSFERQAGLEPLLDKIVVKRLPVLDDAHVDPVRAPDARARFVHDRPCGRVIGAILRDAVRQEIGAGALRRRGDVRARRPR